MIFFVPIGDISWVGPNEVKLDLLDEHVFKLKGGAKEITKPLVFFAEDRIGEEKVKGGPFEVVIVEGTYTSLVDSVDIRVFIDRNYKQTKKHRLKRAREPDVRFLEDVFELRKRLKAQG